MSWRDRPGLRIGLDASRAQMARATGTESYARHVVEGMISMDVPHDFIVYLRGGRGGFVGPRVRERLIEPGRLWTHVGLSLEMWRRPPDVLFVPAHVLPVIRPRRTVVTIHDLGYLFFPAAHSRFRQWYLHLSTAFHVRVATRLIADSIVTKRDLIARYGADPAKIDVIYMGVDSDFRPSSETERWEAKRRFAGGAEYLLCLGTIQPRKNIAGLLQAYGILRRNMERPPDIILAGQRGWRAEAILAHAREAGLLDGVRLMQYVPREDLPVLYGGALALAFPSFYEGFGLPALEAMACGRPVVAAGNSSLPEVVGDAGLLVDPHDIAALAEALQRIAEDDELRAALAERAVLRAARFSWTRCASETLAVIERACGWTS